MAGPDRDWGCGVPRGGVTGPVHGFLVAAVLLAALPARGAAQHEHHTDGPPASPAPRAGAPGQADAGPATPYGRQGRAIDVAEGADLLAAVAGAVPGDTIRVRGTHRGDLRILVPLTLAAAGPDARLVGSGRGTVVSVESDSVEVRGLAISGSGPSLERDDAAIKLWRCRGCRILDNRIDESLHGVYLLESADVRVEDNRIRGRADLGEARRGNGIHVYASSGNVIERNRVRGARDGIYFSFADGNDVADNDIAEVRYGLHYMYSDDNRFRGNVFRRNAAGAALMFSERIEFRDNVFADHSGARAYGILLQTAADIVAVGNRIEGNRIGLFMDNAVTSSFRENAIVGNGIGIDMLSSAEGNLFSRNAIAANRIAVRRQSAAGVNEWSVGGVGNYWGDASVLDLDGDGVSERPHEAGDPFVSLAAGRPALALFQETPAARALAWAERAFPVFDLPHVRDPHPLAAPPAGAPAPEARPAGPAAIDLPALAMAALLVGLVPLLFPRLRGVRRGEGPR